MRPSLQSLDATINRDSVLDRLSGVINFAIATVDNLDHDAPFWNEEIDVYLKYADKGIVEGALLALIASRCEELPAQHFQLG